MRLRWPEIAALMVSLLYVFAAADPLYRETSLPDSGELKLRVVFLADAGEPSDQFLSTVKKWIAIEPGKTLAFFPGDNAYPDGLAGPDSTHALKGLMAMVEIVKSCSVRSVFVAGNHDWGPGYNDLRALKNQADLIREKLPRALFVPSPGCPGPVQFDSEGVSFIIIDSQVWFMDKNAVPSSCNPQTKKHAIDSLGKLLQGATWPTILIAHHPILSYGKHAGYYTWKEHLFPLTMAVQWMWLPLPVFGSIYVLGRKYLNPSDQDFASRFYAAYRKEISKALSSYKGKPPFVFAAGHDHNLQVITGEFGNRLHLISGAGSGKKLYSVRSGPGTLFSSSKEGFVLLEIYSGGRSVVRVIEVDRDESVFLLEVPILEK